MPCLELEPEPEIWVPAQQLWLKKWRILEIYGEQTAKAKNVLKPLTNV